MLKPLAPAAAAITPEDDERTPFGLGLRLHKRELVVPLARIDFR